MLQIYLTGMYIGFQLYLIREYFCTIYREAKAVKVVYGKTKRNQNIYQNQNKFYFGKFVSVQITECIIE